MNIELSNQQEDALRAIQAGHPRTFRLSGAAGTGKTTLAKHIIISNPDLDIRVCAPTNRAAAVLRSKGVPGAMTLHSALYHVSEQELREQLKQIDVKIGDLRLEPPSISTDVYIAQLQKQMLDIERQIEVLKKYKRSAKRPIFHLSEANALKRAGMLIIDEASMVTNEVYNDALKALPEASRIIAIGDHQQLPPVSRSDRGFFNETKPDFRLTKPFRVAKTQSDLLHITTLAFAPGLDDSKDALTNLFVEAKGDGSTRHFGYHSPPTTTWKEADIIISHTNKTRHLANRSKRNLLGLSGDPQKGEPVVALATDRNGSVKKGEIYRITAVSPCEHNPDRYWDMELFLNGMAFVTKASKEAFEIVDGLIDDPSVTKPADYTAAHYGIQSAQWFAFAYAVTCHSAQGGEWDKVLVLDEQAYDGRMFKTPSGKEDRRRWRYTAITRAKEKLTVVNWAPWLYPPTVDRGGNI